VLLKWRNDPQTLRGYAALFDRLISAVAPDLSDRSMSVVIFETRPRWANDERLRPIGDLAS
jgi:hypothetical protein